VVVGRAEQETLPPGPPPILFDFGEFSNIEHHIAHWAARYPGVDLDGEIAAAAQYWTRPDVADSRELWSPQRYLERRFANRLAEQRDERVLQLMTEEKLPAHQAEDRANAELARRRTTR
jgi:hypothetical protein